MGTRKDTEKSKIKERYRSVPSSYCSRHSDHVWGVKKKGPIWQQEKGPIKLQEKDRGPKAANSKEIDR